MRCRNEYAKLRTNSAVGGGGFVGSYLGPMLARAYPNAQRAMLVRPGRTIKNGEWTPLAADISRRARGRSRHRRDEARLGRPSCGAGVARPCARRCRTNMAGEFPHVFQSRPGAGETRTQNHCAVRLECFGLRRKLVARRGDRRHSTISARLLQPLKISRRVRVHRQFV